MYAKFGDKAQKGILKRLKPDDKMNLFLKELPDIDDKAIKALIENGYYEAMSSSVKKVIIGVYEVFKYIGGLGVVIGAVCDILGNGILNTLTIPDNIWDSHDPGYFLDKEKVIDHFSIKIEGLDKLRNSLKGDPKKIDFIDFIPVPAIDMAKKILYALEVFVDRHNEAIRKEIDMIYDVERAKMRAADSVYSISEKIALFSGVWNGLVDFIGGLLSFVGDLAAMSYRVFDNLDVIFEKFDTLVEILSDFSIEDAFKAFSEECARLKSYFADKDNNDLNWDKIHYCTGYAMAFIGTFFIPFTAFAKPAAVLNKLKKAIVPTELLESISKTSTFVMDKSKKAVETALSYVNDILLVLAKGKDGLTAIIRQLFEKIAKWIIAQERAFLKKVTLAGKVPLSFILFTENSASHINYGEVTITKVNSRLPKNDPKWIVEKYSYRPGSGVKSKSGFNYLVNPSGMHNFNNLNKFVRLVGKPILKGKLPSGAKVYECEVEFFVKEINGWKRKDTISTFFPKSWTKTKIRKVVEEAMQNIHIVDRNRRIGITKDGTEIEFWINLQTREVETAYIIFK